MADAIVPLEAVQYGVETTPGTIVAADTVLELEGGGGSFAPNIERVPVEDRHGVLAVTRDLVVMRGSAMSYSHVLDYEQMAIALACGLDADPVTGAGPYDRVWTPSLTAPNALDTASFEVSFTDGSTRHLEKEFGYAVCTGFAIEGGASEEAKFTADWIGRAQQASTYTTSQSPLTREEIAGGDFGLYIDGTWANLGTTQKTGLIRSFKYTVQTGVKPKFSMDARGDLDFGGILRGELGVQLDIEYWFNGDAATEYAAWEAGTLRAMSLEAAGAGTSTLNLQGMFRYLTPPTFGEDEGIRTLSATLEGRRDATSGNLLSVALTNSVATL